jgi:hypothetical protein
LIGALGAEEPFEVRVYSVDGNNSPDTVLAAGTVQLTGSPTEFNEFLLADVDIDPGILESGNFAVAMCLTEHDGVPAIGRDTDDTIDAGLNHIFFDGAWGPSTDFGLTGDWIQRASIELLP